MQLFQSYTFFCSPIHVYNATKITEYLSIFKLSLLHSNLIFWNVFLYPTPLKSESSKLQILTDCSELMFCFASVLGCMTKAPNHPSPSFPAVSKRSSVFPLPFCCFPINQSIAMTKRKRDRQHPCLALVLTLNLLWVVSHVQFCNLTLHTYSGSGSPGSQGFHGFSVFSKVFLFQCCQKSFSTHSKMDRPQVLHL